MNKINSKKNGSQIFRSGFVSLIGRPNVGKSCLMNNILGSKNSIVSSRPQTTRNKILGIKNHKDAQIIFVDTPGIHRSKTRLGRILVERSMTTYHDADILLFVTDTDKDVFSRDKFILSGLKEVKNPVYLLINKIDLLAKRDILLGRIAKYSEIFRFKEIFPISALMGENVDELLRSLKSYLPEGPKYFPDGVITDQPEKFIMAEFIREKVFRLTNQEIPYITNVAVEDIVPGKSKGVQVVHGIIYVERKSQKGILIGKGGSMLKDIGKASRIEIEKRFGGKIFLELFVKVKKNWTKDEKALYDFGYRD